MKWHNMSRSCSLTEGRRSGTIWQIWFPYELTNRALSPSRIRVSSAAEPERIETSETTPANWVVS